MLLPHGGRLREAARRYGIPLGDWLDLSTGINPRGWPVPALPPEVWLRLPEDDDGLEQAARGHFGCDSLLPVAGSQAAIQSLPLLRPSCRVGILSPGYAEHAQAWRRSGHAVIPLAPEAIESTLDDLDVLLLLNPNNPSGHAFDPAVLLDWHARLAARGGWLVVDEAYIDATPGLSLAPHCPRQGLVVLRSLGKFFGLAGVRVGFVLAEHSLLEALRERLGPWALAHPSRHVARLALEDVAWQTETRARLAQDSARLASLLAAHGLAPHGGSALFQWVRTADAARIHEALARRGILTRQFHEPPSLRFGLPANETEWQRLARALDEVMA
ncbi:MAG TPA: threonine-phosphate decarboxylase [Chromatiales bacterium]|nr:threonine-phosphate decarboxylase [Chromatiales bacterium]